ncbi:MAG TPA: hypothetical protein P5290_00860 [Candidatus Methanomethylicus sp.]|nr:hypothetical protein [Candidatus Methanomethylicus sp.]
MMNTGKLIVLPTLRTHLADLAIMNAMALAVTAIAYFVGYQFIYTFVFVLFFMSGLMLLAGGFAGFMVSSATYHAFSRLLKKRGDEAADRHNGDGKKETVEIKQSNQGGRIVILGAVMLIESILLALIAV